MDADRRFVYCGFSLKNNTGHHANMCRQIVAEVRRRNIPVHLLAPQDIWPELAGELNALPFFRISTSRYPLLSQDPLCGMMTHFFLASELTLEDWTGVEGVGPGDIIYLSFAQPYQLHACIAWAKAAFPPGDCPHFIFELGSLPGLTIHPDKSGPERYTLHNLSPTFFRYALTFLPPELASRFHFIASVDTFATQFSEVLGRPVTMAPMPQTAVSPPRRRTPAQDPILSFLGYQSREKGFHLVPELAEQLLSRHAQLRILVHDSSPGDLPEATARLRALAIREPRLKISGSDHPATWDHWIRGRDLAAWGQLLDQTDLLILPYARASYGNLPSGVGADGIAHGIPMVFPGETTHARLVTAFGGGGVPFGEESLPSILAAVEEALLRFDDLAERAFAGAALWEKQMGSGPFVELLWRLAGWNHHEP